MGPYALYCNTLLSCKYIGNSLQTSFKANLYFSNALNYNWYFYPSLENLSNTKIPTLPTLCITGKLGCVVTSTKARFNQCQSSAHHNLLSAQIANKVLDFVLEYRKKIISWSVWILTWMCNITQMRRNLVFLYTWPNYSNDMQSVGKKCECTFLQKSFY